MSGAALAELVAETARATVTAAESASTSEDARALAVAGGVLSSLAAILADQARPAHR